MSIGDITKTANGLVTRDRNTDYGDPVDDFARTVQLYHILKGSTVIEKASDGILFMICVKLSRERNKHKQDNIVDLCGYADIWDYALEKEQDAANESHCKKLKDCTGLSTLKGLEDFLKAKPICK